jgi:hypothetical protein
MLRMTRVERYRRVQRVLAQTELLREPTEAPEAGLQVVAYIVAAERA